MTSAVAWLCPKTRISLLMWSQNLTHIHTLRWILESYHLLLHERSTRSAPYDCEEIHFLCHQNWKWLIGRGQRSERSTQTMNETTLCSCNSYPYSVCSMCGYVYVYGVYWELCMYTPVYVYWFVIIIVNFVNVNTFLFWPVVNTVGNRIMIVPYVDK